MGNLVFKQDIGILIETDRASFWASLFLYIFFNVSIQNNLSQLELLKHINIIGFQDSLTTYFVL